jgi:hypothetical protein
VVFGHIGCGLLEVVASCFSIDSVLDCVVFGHTCSRLLEVMALLCGIDSGFIEVSGVVILLVAYWRWWSYCVYSDFNSSKV